MLRDLKQMLGFDPDEEDQNLDAKLNWILSSVKGRLKLKLGGIEPPEEMNHIITEVSIIRYNRIGSEGMESHTVEGESQGYIGNDFDGFEDEIQAFLDTQRETKRGKVRFL
ncbi:MAG: phage head-tail connector protein [Ruminococcus sp.]|nr:phage head-tail connector protein [Ruminococcus sp.]